jgi:glutamate racemase
MIGIFDSGIGGLTVARELRRRAPQADFLYLGDTARTPYGNKSSETVCQYAVEDAGWLIAQGATTVIVACNTVSAWAMDVLHATYPNVQFFDVISAAVREAATVSHHGVGVIGTRSTISSHVYEQRLRELRSDLSIHVRACPLFVPLVEEGWLVHAETKRIARQYLRPLQSVNIDTLILGCTHYPLLREVIQRAVGRRVQLVDSAVVTVRDLLTQHAISLEGGGRARYAFTDIGAHTLAIARRWLQDDTAEFLPAVHLP